MSPKFIHRSLRTAPPPANESPVNGSPVNGTSLSRRNFVKLGLGALSALAALEAGGVALLYLKPRSLQEQFGGLVTAGAVQDFPAGSVTEFTEGRFYLARAHDGGFLAVYCRCPHLGCTVNWVADKERFYCPCHASSFDAFGNFQNSPVPRALDLFPIKIVDGEVKVDTSVLIQRERFEPQQLVYA